MFRSVKKLLLIGVSLLLLTGCGKSMPKMELGDLQIVWKDYEKATYDFLVDGTKRAESVFTIDKTSDQYKIDTLLEIDGGTNATGAVVRAADMQPVSSYFKNLPPATSQAAKVEVQGKYENSKLQIEAVQGGKEQKLSVSLQNPVLDNESVLMAIRNFPLKEGYEKDILIAIVSSAQIAPYKIKVAGLENVIVPYGEIQCYKVVMQYTGKGSVPDMYAWYSADDQQLMVKYQNRNVSFELKALDTGR